MTDHVITCSRCGQQNRGSFVHPARGPCYDESGWVDFFAAVVSPIEAPDVCGSSEVVCPGCQTMQENPATLSESIRCGRCGRENEASLGSSGFLEWDEGGWAFCS